MTIFNNKIDVLRSAGFTVIHSPHELTTVGHDNPFYWVSATGLIRPAQQLNNIYQVIIAGEYESELPLFIMCQQHFEQIITQLQFQNQLQQAKKLYDNLFQNQMDKIKSSIEQLTPGIHTNLTF